jgi:hypothetical protein
MIPPPLKALWAVAKDKDYAELICLSCGEDINTPIPARSLKWFWRKLGAL